MSEKAKTPEDRAEVMLSAPDPVRALAFAWADAERRLDAFARRIHALEAQIEDVGVSRG